MDADFSTFITAVRGAIEGLIETVSANKVDEPSYEPAIPEGCLVMKTYS